ncbi:MAG: transcription-repair coupling factor [Alphaproteobacteria bacterium]|nr:transcription-repair coupling factor [Alphaproteobacteria bacterium]
MFTSGWNLDNPGCVTLAGAPEGHDARLLAEIAERCAGKPVLHVALDDARAAVLGDALGFFAPHCEVVAFPAWDCLPYDRVSPHADIVAARIAALGRLRGKFKQPCVVLTTAGAIAQKTLPPEVLEQACLDAGVGDALPVEKLRLFLAQNGYVNAGAVREAGEFAVRGGIVDLFPPGYDAPLRLDFFGDEIESIRVFDPLTQTTTDKIDRFHLGPIAEVILSEAAIAQFRSHYRALFGAVTDSDALYESVTQGQKFPGVEHWLGLFYPRLYSLFDYAPDAPVVFDPQSFEAIESRLQQIDDFYQARLGLYQAAKRAKKKDGSAPYKPAPVEGLYMRRDDFDAALKGRAVAVLSPFGAVDPVIPDSSFQRQECVTITPTQPSPIEGEGFTSPQGKTLPLYGGGVGNKDQTLISVRNPRGNDDVVDCQAQRGRDFSAARVAQPEQDLYAELQAYITAQQKQNRRVALACYSQGSADRMAGLLRTHGISAQEKVPAFDALRKLDTKLVALVILGLEHGFTSPDLAVITEQDILGDRLVRPARKRRAAKQFQLELGSLNVGDFVVHAEHGIGRYEGLETVTVLGLSHDCVKLIYDGGDKLFVPVENLDLLTRYGGAESGAVLDKLGGLGWQQRKSRVKKRLKDMADALMKIAAEREIKTGEVIEVPEGVYQEFAARFPYAETEDQERAITEVLSDLSSGKPMDRLVCGDVGFGKTEVALRAAFAAVQAGLQVAVVVPTTLLARQHYNNFTERFRGFPIRIAQLSRMVSASDAKCAKEEMKAGRVDIVIGTHALLGKDVAFRSLGLMIIDEEQHFGVKQKERLKEFRAEVHVLTLTATPIPRTLQLALAGVRELSLIATPPLDRLSVRTFVLPYDPLVIREALMREHYRGGQSFYVCPHVEDLTGVAEALRELVPEVKIVTAHGRMSATQLEDIMTAFDARQFDILLATNIVESGLDIPNANTIILHRADRFGLAGLYQLRGRVGRGKLRGYAYLTYEPNKALSQTALKRLEVIQTLEQLGAGFQLASHDMDIRGAGNLLGEEQSGHVREVGVELYQQMLEDAVAAARMGSADAEGAPDRWTPQINLGLSVLIPETYVADLNVRLGLYRRLADIADDAEIEALAAEIIDRFGALPEEVENLLQTVAIKQICRKAGVAKVDAAAKGAILSFHKDKFARPDRLIAWIAKNAGAVMVRPDQKLVVMRAWDGAEARLEGVKKLLGELVGMAA